MLIKIIDYSLTRADTRLKAGLGFMTEAEKTAVLTNGVG